MSHSKYLRILIFLAVGLPYSYATQALPTDSEQPIHIVSNAAERDAKRGITIYSGDVQMNQGTLSIKADRVVIHSDSNNKVSKIIATGSPAHYQQIPEIDQPLVVAKGNTIVYSIRKDQLRLTDKASLQQNDGTTLTGNSILYDIKAAVVKAESDKSTSGERIHMGIPPKAQRQ